MFVPAGKDSFVMVTVDGNGMLGEDDFEIGITIFSDSI